MTGICAVYLSEKENMNDYLSLKDSCGLNEIEDLGTLITLIGLFNLQHRGQLSAKIVNSKGKVIEGKGLAVNILKNKRCVANNSKICMGSVNNYFNGEKTPKENCSTLVNNKKISFVNDGHPIFQNMLNQLRNTTLSDKILNSVKNSKKKNIVSKIKEALSKIKGSHSWIFNYDNSLIAVRQGATPLFVCSLKGNSLVFASEPCAFRDMNVKNIKALEAGEIIIANKDNLSKNNLTHLRLNKFDNGCIFELVYRSRPDSSVFSENVAKFRIKLGEELGKTEKIKSDLITPIPESGIFSATGFSKEVKIPLIFVLLRDYTMGRYFFEPDQSKRNALIKRKLKVIKELVQGKKIVVVDEAIITGTTIRIVSDLLRKSDAKEIHIRIPSPIHKSPCNKGILSPRKDLLFNRLIKDDKKKDDDTHIESVLKDYFGVDSIKFLDKERFLNIANKKRNTCTECINK